MGPIHRVKAKVAFSCAFITLLFVFSTLTKRDDSLKTYNEKMLKMVDKIRQRQQRRKLLLDSVCNITESRANESLSHSVVESLHPFLDHFIVDDTHKLIYCFVPKVASTNWKRVLLSIDTFQHHNDFNPLSIKGSQSQARSIFKTLDQIKDINEVTSRLQNYVKFTFVRNPFERLLSAFRNKFESAYNDYFRQRFGRKIIKQYRINSTKSSLDTGNDVTFHEFLNYVADLDSSNYMSAFNEHWRPINDLCFPCLIQFDVIGKHETLEEDAFLVLWETNLFNFIRFPQRNETYSSTPTSELISKYYSSVPRDLMSKILNLYERDLKLFSYDLNLDK